MNAMRLEDTIYKDFTTHNPNTGSVSDADSTPTCAVYEDSTDTAILSPTVVKRTSLTGNYRVPIAMTSANGFEVGRSYNVIVTATVNGVIAKDCIDSFIIDTPRRPTGLVVTDAGNSATQFKSDRSEATTDHWKDVLILFATGTLAGQIKKVTGYNGTTKIFTFTNGYTGTPSNGDVFEIINI